MAFPRRARRLWGYWRAEQRTLRQGSVALLLSTAAAFVAGLTLSSIEETLLALPGLLILIPAASGMRGTISGAIGARLGTSIHVGLFEATGKRSGVLAQNVEVGVVMTLASSLYLAILAKFVGSAFGENTISIWDYVTISVVGGALSAAVILFVTVVLAIVSYRRGYDLDAVGTPMITAIGDMVTIPCLFLATFIVRFDRLNAAVAAISVALGIAAIVRGATAAKAVRRILLEMVGVALLTPILDVIAGVFLQAQFPTLFGPFPGLLMLIPPFVSQAGALGGILSSRLASKLQLGVITARGLPESPAAVDGSIVGGFALFVFTLIGGIGVLLSGLSGRAIPGIATTMSGTLLAGGLATVLVLALGYYVAVATSRFGLDPDNISVPLITSTMDLAGVACIVTAMSLLGVGNG